MRDVATWNGVLAFGIGLVFACALEPAVLGRRREVVATEPATPTGRPLPMERTVADEPTAAEREEAAASADTRTVERSETTVR